MSKEARTRVSDVGCDESSAPYSTRREKSRKLAQKRRDTYKQIMDDLTNVLPFPKEAVSQLDYNSRLRLALCFFRLKTMMDSNGEVPATATPSEDTQTSPDSGMQIVRKKFVSDTKPALFQPGALQDLMTEALDGFLMVTQVDGTIVFLSESIHKHLGLFQSEHIGVNMFELIHEEDHADVRSKISDAELKSLNQKGAAKVTFFCRMKCSRYKVANVITKSPGYKLVYISGTIKRARGEPFIACVVRPVSPPSVLEIRLEGNMFVCRYGVDFTCTYFDGRLRPLLGYDKDDLIGKQPFDLFHHEDIAAIVKCRNKVFEKGESLSGYYRFFNSHGQSIWLQTRATLIIDSRTGKPVCVNCMFFVISKEDGDRDLQMRLAIQNGESNIKEENIHSHDPFPVIERSDGTVVNPLEDDKVPSPDTTAAVDSSPSSSSVVEADNSSISGTSLSPDLSEISSHTPPTISSSSGIGHSTSSLHSVESGMGIPHGRRPLHGSSSSVNSGAISSGDSVFTDRSSPQELISSSVMTTRTQSTSPDKIESCLPDSTTSGPHSVQQHNGNLAGMAVGKVGSTSSSADLGYRSASNSSSPLRDRLSSGVSYGSSPMMKRTESNASSIIPDTPLSANSSLHSIGIGSQPPHSNSTQASVPSMSSPAAEFHSQSPFHAISSLSTSTLMQGQASSVGAAGMGNGGPPVSYQNPSSKQYGDVRYAHNQPINGNGFPLQTNQQQFGGPAGLNYHHQHHQQQIPGVSGMSDIFNGSSTQQQFTAQPPPLNPLQMNGSVGATNLANSLPDWIPDQNGTTAAGAANFNTPFSLSTTIPPQPTQQPSSLSMGYPSSITVPLDGTDPSLMTFQTTAGPGFQFISPPMPLSGSSAPQEMYNPPSVLSTASNFYMESTVQGHAQNPTHSFQQLPKDPLCNDGRKMAPPTSELPQLTGEDLQILDAFDPVGRQDNKFLFQQTACQGTAMM